MVVKQVNEITLEVDSIYQAINPSYIDYLFNARRIEMMTSQIDELEYPSKLNVQLLLAKEYLRGSEIEKSLATVQEIENALTNLNIELPIEIMQKFLLLKATINLRKGELDNCIENHQSTSCIVPFSQEAVHIRKSGSKEAIVILQDILKINPNNEAAIYLLNIAYETIQKDRSDLALEYQLDFKEKKSADLLDRWENIAGHLGVDHFGLAGGVALDDFNGDGWIDIICSSWGNKDRLVYFENDGQGGFVDMSEKSKLNKIAGGLNINHTDFNNDGHLDIYVMRGGWFESEGLIPNSLIRNNGDGTFSEVTKELGLYSRNPTQSSIWIDVNCDGWLDLFVANESTQRSLHQCELWLNHRGERFTNITKESGITKQGFYKAASPIYVGKDSSPSIFLSNYRGENVLYRNYSTEDNIRFAIESDKNISKPIMSFSSMSLDVNNDGLEDIIVSGYGSDKDISSPVIEEYRSMMGKTSHAHPYIYMQQDNGNFSSVDLISQGVYTMGCNFGDINGDGFLDLFLATGDPAISSIVPNKVFLNRKGREFVDRSYGSGMAHLQKGHAVGFADFDHDGDEDIYNVLGGAYEGDGFQNALFENPKTHESWIILKLIGVMSNRAAVGARVHLQVKDKSGKVRSIYRTVGTGASFGGNSLQLEIGLGSCIEILSCEVNWPFDRPNDVYDKLEINNKYLITEGGEATQLEYKSIEFKVKSNQEHTHHH